MKPETLTLVFALAAAALFFGPAIARLILKPVRGSVTDLRIAAFEAFVADFDKWFRVRDKLKARIAAESAVDAAPLTALVVDVVTQAPSADASPDRAPDSSPVSSPTEKADAP